jgi:hypothetical protein
VLLNGGTDDALERLDTWTFDGVAWSLSPALAPTGFGMGAAFDELRGRVVEFGGYSGPPASLVFSRETWEWDGSTWTSGPLTGPSARRWPAMAWDGVNQRTLLFGGEDSSGTLGDTWLWGG